MATEPIVPKSPDHDTAADLAPETSHVATNAAPAHTTRAMLSAGGSGGFCVPGRTDCNPCLTPLLVLAGVDPSLTEMWVGLVLSSASALLYPGLQSPAIISSDGSSVRAIAVARSSAYRPLWRYCRFDRR